MNAERAVLDLCNTKLGIAIGPDCIDRTHRLGAPDSSAHNEGARPQPIIVKFTSYRAPRCIHGQTPIEGDEGGDNRELNKASH